jgi:hypothetical protein
MIREREPVAWIADGIVGHLTTLPAVASSCQCLARLRLRPTSMWLGHHFEPAETQRPSVLLGSEVVVLNQEHFKRVLAHKRISTQTARQRPYNVVPNERLVYRENPAWTR